MKEFILKQAERLKKFKGDKLIHEFEKLYERYGSSIIYDICNAMQYDYHDCKPCEASTPTIVTRKYSCCAVCGTEKSIPELVTV